ncbi:MAG: hypothetical protein HC855_12435 [Rhizobiales bacterium]|nr:hypothetical protein [Hyphomicrobiales bacterium]
MREYIWLEGMPVMAIDGVNTATPVLMAVHTDHLTRPIRLTNASKTQVWNAVWTPFGTAHAIAGTATQNLRFPGQYFLIEQGLAYNWHRFYDPTTGRYTQPDPLGFVDGPAIYAYAGNSPLMNVDPDGKQRIRLPGSSRPGVVPFPNSPVQRVFDRYGLAMSRSCPPPPGDCNDREHRRFQNDVDNSCKRDRACSKGMTSSDLSMRAIMNGSCGRARERINKKCFRGGDETHRDQAADAWKSQAKCEELLWGATR